MKADTTKVGAELEVSHGWMVKADGTGCHGDVAKVLSANDTTFLAECQCGWRFGGSHTDGYRAPESAPAPVPWVEVDRENGVRLSFAIRVF